MSTYSVILMYDITSLFQDFFLLNRKLFFKSKKCHQISVQHVRISRKNTSLAYIRQFWFLRQFWGEKRKKSWARFFIKPKVTWNRFCWFSIANTGLPMATSYQNLNKIGQKWRLWECGIRKLKMAVDDVINIRYQKFEKNDTGPCPGDYLCENSSKSAQPFRL